MHKQENERRAHKPQRELAGMSCPNAPTEEVRCRQWLPYSASWYLCGRAAWRVCSASKFSPSTESMGKNCSEWESDCRAPGYPCSGRGNVCDYLLCKPASWRRKKRGGGMDSKDSLSSNCVFVRALAGGIMCMQVRVCVCVACFDKEMSRGKYNSRVGIVFV